MKKNNKKGIIWLAIAFIVGAIIGILITNVVPTGQATKIQTNTNNTNFKTMPYFNIKTEYDLYAIKEMEKEANKLGLKQGEYYAYRETTNGELKPSSKIIIYPKKEYSISEAIKDVEENQLKGLAIPFCTYYPCVIDTHEYSPGFVIVGECHTGSDSIVSGDLVPTWIYDDLELYQRK